MPRRRQRRTMPPGLLLAVSGLAVSGLTGPASAQWPQFRGPGGLSRPAAEPAIEIPFDLDRDVRWKVRTPAGHSSPVVSEDRIFLSGYEGNRRHMLAYDRSTGKELWRRSVEALAKVPDHTAAASPAMPSPCTDGGHVYFYFGAYGVIACTVGGEIEWQKRLPVPQEMFGTGNSPILVDGVLVVVRDGAEERAVIGLDCRDGSERWRIRRLTYITSYTTPFVWHTDARKELVLAGTGQLVSHDPKSGKQLWRVGNMPLFVCPSPTASADTLFCAAWTPAHGATAPVLDSMFGTNFFSAKEARDERLILSKLDKDGNGEVEPDELPDCPAKKCFAYADCDRDGSWNVEEIRTLVESSNAPTRNVCAAIKAGGDGDVTETHVRWTYSRGLPYVASPLLVQNRLYMVKSGGLITCLDAKTGEAHYRQKRLDDHGDYFASPVAIGNYVLVCANSGVAFLLKDGEKFDAAHRADFGEAIHATPAVLRNTLIVRTATHLWCVGSQ